MKRLKPRLPREAWMQLRKGGVQTTKKGKRGYNRKSIKRRKENG